MCIRDSLQGAGGRQFAFGKDKHLLTDRLHLAEDMAGQNDGVGLAQLPDEFAHFDHLRRVQAHGRLVQNDDLWAAQQSLRNAHPLFIALGQAADEPGQHFFQPRPPCLLYTSDAADEEDSVDLGGCWIIEKKKKSKSNRKMSWEES